MMKDLLDKKFVITSVILGSIYVGIVIFINLIVGKEAAGIAGVALTALATAIFKQFERLRFTETKDDAINLNLGFSWGQVCVISFFFAGINLYFQEIKDYIIPYIGETIETKIFNNEVSKWKDIGIVSIYDHSIVINNYSVWEKAVESLAFFLGGLLVANSWPNISYSVVVIGSLLGVILDFLREDLMNYFFGISSLIQLKDGFEEYEYSFLYIIFALAGCYLTSNKNRN